MNAVSSVLGRALIACILAGVSVGVPLPVEAATFAVNTTDDLDDGTCSAAHCSLREAINAANSRSGEDTIAFSLPGTGPHFIVLTEVLPSLAGYGTIVDGESQPGYAGTPLVRIQGERAELPYAFEVRGDYITIQGLSLGGFGVAGSPTDGAIVVASGIRALIRHNYLGLGVDGSPIPNSNGVCVLPGAISAEIDGNVISANSGAGITSGARNTYIHANRIGTNPEGTASAGEQGIGVSIGGSAQSNLVGGMTYTELNLISGNGTGVSITAGEGHAVLRNRIGTDMAGREAIPNDIGIALGSLPLGAIVQGNLISGNREVGLELRSNNSLVSDNWVGVTSSGTSALPNAYGIIVYADGNSIGSREVGGRGNVISGNTREGIRIYASWTGLYGNLIGTDASGSAAIPNGTGIQIDGGDRTLIDGSTPAGPNFISGNREVGLRISNGDFTSVLSNYIGVNLSAEPLPNGIGIQIESSQHTEVGRHGFAENVIRSNGIGLALYNGAAGTRLTNNIIAENSDHGLILSGVDGVEANQFSQNSFYDNGGPGIEFLESGVNGGVAPPSLESLTFPTGPGRGGAITGTTCPGCSYELFQVDPDPTGRGEGKHFYGGGIADEATGHFVYPIAPGTSDRCMAVTATTTDPAGNTSEFAANLGAVFCLDIPPIGLLLGIPFVAALGALGGLAGGGRRRRPWLAAAGGGIAGGVVAVILLVGVSRLPGVRIRAPQAPSQAEQAGPPLPPCSQLVAILQPAQGALLEPGAKVAIELSPQPDPPGTQTEWTFVVVDPSGVEGRRTSRDPRATLSDVGFDPAVSGWYTWSAEGIRTVLQTGQAGPFCEGQPHGRFFVGPLPELILETPLYQGTATSTPTPAPPRATFLQNANCRRGPAMDYDVVTSLQAGQDVDIEGRNGDSTWWWIRLPQSQAHCWVAGNVVQTSGDLSTVLQVAAPPKPTATPVQGCLVFVPNLQKNVCTVPCPANAQPGGVCTP